MADLQEENQPTVIPRKRRLTTKQANFVANMLNTKSDTYGNGTKSVLAIPSATGKRTYDAASVQASDYLDSPRIQSELQAIANESGMTYQFRFKTLSLIAQGQYVTTETVTRMYRGKPRTETITRTPKASEVIKAIDVASKLVGDYEANRARGNAMSTRFRELARLYRPKLSKQTAKRLHIDDDEEVLEVVSNSIQSTVCTIGCLLCIDSTSTDTAEVGVAS